MFKNNKIKKLLAFSIISSSFVFCGTSASSVVKRSRSFGGFDSGSVKMNVIRSLSLNDLDGVSGYKEKVTPFNYLELPDELSRRYKIEPVFTEEGVEFIFRGTAPNNQGRVLDEGEMGDLVYAHFINLNQSEIRETFNKIIRE